MNNALDENIINGKPLVSVIVPVFNGENTVERVIQCLLSQDYENKEFVFVNDGSSDSTAEILERYCDKIKIIHKANGGVSSARNAGLDSAVGKYVIFVDADDVCESNELSISVTAAESEYADLAVFGFLREKDGKVISRHSCKKIVYTADEIIKNIGKIMTCALGSPYNKVFSKIIIEKYHIRFDERLPLGEDMNFFIRYLFKCNRILFIPDILYRYSIDNNVATNKYRENMYEIRMAALDEMCGLFEEQGLEYPFYEVSRLKLVFACIFNLQNKLCSLTNMQKRALIKGYISDYRKCGLKGFKGKNIILDFILRRFPCGLVNFAARIMKKMVHGISVEKRGISV